MTLALLALPALQALTLGVAPELWVTTRGFDTPACDATAFAAAIHTQRPTETVHPWQPEAHVETPPKGAIVVTLVARDGVAVLEVTGGAAPIVRTLAEAVDCKRDVEIAALIVDGALDDLRVSQAAPKVDSLAAPVPFRSLVQAGVAFGAGVEQSPSGWVASLDIEGVARYRFYELTLDVDLGLPSSTSFAIANPETGTGSLSVTSLSAELGIGVAPRLGPGRASLDALLGVSVAFATASDSSSSKAVFQNASETAVDFFTGLRAGYVLELPRGFILGARAEERLAPRQAAFGVVGTNPSTFSVNTRAWTLQTLGLVGYRFF